MASWLMHLAIAKAVTKHLDLNVRKFNFGNLLPDASMQDPITKSKSHFRIEREPYEHTTTDNYQFFDYYRFLAKNSPNVGMLRLSPILFACTKLGICDPESFKLSEGFKIM